MSNTHMPITATPNPAPTQFSNVNPYPSCVGDAVLHVHMKKPLNTRARRSQDSRRPYATDAWNDPYSYYPQEPALSYPYETQNAFADYSRNERVIPFSDSLHALSNPHSFSDARSQQPFGDARSQSLLNDARSQQPFCDAHSHSLLGDARTQQPLDNSHSQSPFYPERARFTREESASSEIAKGTPFFSLVRHRLDEILALRNQGADVESQYIALSKEYPTCYLVWLERSRYEMDKGNIRRCRDVVLRGLAVLPGNAALLEKRVKVEERLRNVDGVIECAEAFLDMNSKRCVKNIVEAAVSVAKLGYGYKASDLFTSLIHHNLFTQGGVTLDYIRFVFKTEDYQRGLTLLKDSLSKLTKHGPIWFFTFSVLEQNHTIFWKLGDIASRPYNRDLEAHLNQALLCLADDLKWKVFYIAAQAQLRSFTHIRLRTRLKKRYLLDYCRHYPQVIVVCFHYLRDCVLLCSHDYKWKVWLLAGRVLALAGRRKSAIKVEVVMWCEV